MRDKLNTAENKDVNHNDKNTSLHQTTSTDTIESLQESDMPSRPRRHLDSQRSTKTLRESFNVSHSQSSGGVTGSKRVADKNDSTIYYQLKPSIQNHSLFKRIKAHGTDRENFGEFISSCIGRNIVRNIKTDGVIPQIELIYDEEKKRVMSI
ncbi:MAG: hypothetical protein ACRCXC_08315 [Legionella sp.]